MQQFIGGTAMMAFWYHFAIMFEALFILTDRRRRHPGCPLHAAGLDRQLRAEVQGSLLAAGAWLGHRRHGGRLGRRAAHGRHRPLGGINTLFPLFGIANQLLAAIALAVCLAIVAKRGTFKYLWIVALPLAFAAVVTITASYQKIFSPVPAVGYFANNAAFAKALAEGKTSFGTAKTVPAMEAVVRNTAIQGWLSVIFVVLSIIVIVTAIAEHVHGVPQRQGRGGQHGP